MKIKLFTIINARPAIEKIRALPLKPQAALMLMRNMRSILREISDYDKVYTDAVIKYGVKNPDGSYSVVPEKVQNPDGSSTISYEKIKTFSAEMEQALDEEISLPEIITIPYSVITSEISATDLDLLSWLFNFSETSQGD